MNLFTLILVILLSFVMNTSSWLWSGSDNTEKSFSDEQSASEEEAYKNMMDLLLGLGKVIFRNYLYY